MRKMLLPLTVILALLFCVSAEAQVKLLKKGKSPSTSDYKLITNSPGCSAAAGTLSKTSSTGNGCPGSNSTLLTLSGTINGSLQWYYSLDGVEFEPLDDTTGNSYTATYLTDTTYYAVEATLIGINGTCWKWSNTVMVAIATPVWYRDADGDGYATTIIQCQSPGFGYTLHPLTPAGDCNDNNASIHPGAPELFDGIDNNCDGSVDEGWVTSSFTTTAPGFQDLTIPPGMSSITVNMQGARGGSLKNQFMFQGQPAESPATTAQGGAGTKLNEKL